MAFDPTQLRGIERRRYVLDHAPGILCALIGRRASTDPENLIDLAIQTACALFDKIEPEWSSNGRSSDNFVHTNGSA